MTNKETITVNGVEITFYPDSHQYRINGKRITSVTTVLGLVDKSRQLLKWSENLTREFLLLHLEQKLTGYIIESAVTQYSQKRDEAGDVGKSIHKLCEQFIEAVLFDKEKPLITSELSEQVLNGYNAFLDWYNSNNVEFILSERIVYSKKHNYIGTFDVLMKVNGVLILGDFKTGKDIYPETWLQLGAYNQALNEEKKYKVKEFMILHFNKENGEFAVHTKKVNEVDINQFNNLLTLKRYLGK